jgi:hypothetical protein
MGCSDQAARRVRNIHIDLVQGAPEGGPGDSAGGLSARRSQNNASTKRLADLGLTATQT